MDRIKSWYKRFGVVVGYEAGAERGARNAVLDYNNRIGFELFSVRGFCPSDMSAEDGTIPPGIVGIQPVLSSEEARDRLCRWRKSVDFADAVVIFSLTARPEGIEVLESIPKSVSKPYIVFDQSSSPYDVGLWCEKHSVSSIAFFGVRESRQAGVQRFAEVKTLDIIGQWLLQTK